MIALHVIYTRLHQLSILYIYLYNYTVLLYDILIFNIIHCCCLI